MSSVEWCPTDHMGMNSTAPDLFGGELFGDELIDMYNSDAVVGANEIPHMLSSEEQHLTSNTMGHGERLSLNDPNFDDGGLSTFRPCSPFNDLTSLLPATPSAVISSCDHMMSVTIKLEENECSTSGIKRSNTEDFKSLEPSPKKRSIIKSRVSPGPKKLPANPTSTSNIQEEDVNAMPKLLDEQQHAVKNEHSGRVVNATPNPLSITSLVKSAINPTNVVTPHSHPNSNVENVGVHHQMPATISMEDQGLATNIPVSNVITESNFQSVAQAAVSTLILNAGTTKVEAVHSSSIDDKVDTSTAHIKALTSPNWVTACAGNSVADNDDASTSATDSKVNRARRQNLTPDERARQNRDRNREHARNTRLRKKAYVEELKRTLTELVAQRDAAELEKRHAAQRELEQREVRFRVMEEFLKLRGRNESCYGRWSAILEDAFTLTLPVTNYRKMVQRDNAGTESVYKTEQVLLGATEAMEDATYVASFLHSLGSGMEEYTHRGPINICYKCERKNFYMDECNTMMIWTAATAGVTLEGAPSELIIKGTMSCRFSPASNKLISAEIMFDSGSITTQLQMLESSKRQLHVERDNCDVIAAAAAAAQAAAHDADALLDSLQMPQLGDNVPSAINFMTSSSEGNMSGANTVSDKDDSSDEGFGELMSH